MNDKIFYILVTVFTLVLFGGILFLAARPSSSPITSEDGSINVSQEELVGENPHIFGTPLDESEVVIVEFADFQCPYCKNAWSVITTIKEDFGDDVSYVYRHFPLTNIHNYAFDAAIASEAASEQGVFFEYHDILYRNQSDNQNPLTEEDFISFAEELELDIEQFREDLNSNEMRSRVSNDLQAAQTFGLSSTPSIFVNGETIPYTELYSRVEELVVNQDEAVEEEQELTPANTPGS